MRVAHWKENSRGVETSSAELLPNDARRKVSPYGRQVGVDFRTSVMLKRDQFFVCDHATPNVSFMSLSKEQMFLNCSACAWEFKTLIGSNSLVPNCEEAIRNYLLKSNISVDEKKRALFTFSNNNSCEVYDVETMVSLILEYGLYLAYKTCDNSYDELSKIASIASTSLNHLILPVFSVFCFLFQIPSYFTKAHLEGIQFALDCKSLGQASFVYDNVATAIDFYYHRNEVGSFSNDPTTVLFIDMGHVATTCTLVRFSKVWLKGVFQLELGGGRRNRLPTVRRS